MFKIIAKVAGCIAVGAPLVSYAINERAPVDHLNFYRDKKTKQITFASARVPSEFDDYEEWTRTPMCKYSNEEFIKFVQHEYRHPCLRTIMRTIRSSEGLPTYSLEYYIHMNLYLSKIKELEAVV